MKYNKNIKVITLLSFVIAGCATVLPTKTTINDFVLMGIKTNSSKSVTYSFESKVVDGKKVPVDNKGKPISGHPGWIVNENLTLGSMLNEYMSNKFIKFNEGNDLIINVVFENIEIMQGTQPGQSTGQAIMEGLAGIGKGLFEVKLSLLLTINDGDEEKIKRILVTTQETYMAGNLNEPIDEKLASAVDKANNKALMLINSYFEELGI